MKGMERAGVLVSLAIVALVWSAPGWNGLASHVPTARTSPLSATVVRAGPIAISSAAPLVASSGGAAPIGWFQPSVTSARAPATTVTVNAGFPGVSSTNSSCGCAPPDVQVAVGNSDVVQMVNLEGKIWTKAGGALSSFTLASFFLTGSDSTSDPRVLFDNSSGRWFATLLDITSGTIHTAVSSTGDPTGNWSVYSIGGSPGGDFPDQPILGVDKTLVAIGGNVFNSTTFAFVQGEVWALNKTSMLAGAFTYYSIFHSTSWFSMHPVKSLSSSTTEYVVMTAGSSKVDLFKLTGSPSAKTSAHLSSATGLTVKTFSTPPSSAQKGTTDKLDTGDTRVQDAVWKTNDLWLSFNSGCKPVGDSVTRGCVRLVELATGTTPAVTQDLNISKAKGNTFYGAISLDGSRNVGVVFGYANSTTYPAVFATGHLHGAANGSLLAWKLLKSGASSVTVACTGAGVCRWGDYYGAGADPKSPNLWVSGEYVASSVYWSTWVASIRV